MSERERDLLRRRDAIAAELAGIRSGVLTLLEERRNSPDLARTPGVLADVLGMSVQAVNNHCARMFRAGVVDRVQLTSDGGGRRFAYRVREALAVPDRPEDTDG